MIIIFDKFCDNSNQFYENDFDNLLKGIKEGNANITGLDVRGELNPGQFKELFQVLKSNKNIKDLILRGKNFKCDLSDHNIYIELSSLLGSSKTIENLTLFHTDLESEGIKCIINALEENNTLKYLKICGHNIDINGELALIKMLEKGSSLKDLTLDYPSMSEDAKLVLLSQQEHLSPINLSIGLNSYLGLYNTIPKSNEEIGNHITSVIEKKKIKIKNLITKLRYNDFHPDFIKVTEDFFNNNFLAPEILSKIKYEGLVERYEELVTKFLEDGNYKLSYQEKTQKLKELENEYNKLTSQFLQEYQDMQMATLNSLYEMDETVSNQAKKIEYRIGEVKQQETEYLVDNTQKLDNNNEFYGNHEELNTDIQIATSNSHAKMEEMTALKDSETGHETEVKQQKTETIPQEAQFEQLDSNEPKKPIDNIQKEDKLPIFNDLDNNNIHNENVKHNIYNLKEIKLPVPKKLDIDNKLQGAEYISEWTKKVSEADYQFAIFSIGSHERQIQQIPPFSEKLGQVAILNIDMIYNEDETKSTSNSDDVSVNYLQAKIKSCARWDLDTSKHKEKMKQNGMKFMYDDIGIIEQKELADNIHKLMDSGKKVILMPHISIYSPRTHFEEVLKNNDIMDGYGKNFMFIHSYFYDIPIILCSKNFVNFMISSDYKSDNNNVESKEKESEKDSIVANLIESKIYFNKDLFQNTSCIRDEEKLPEEMSGSIVYQDLAHADSHGVMSLLGIDENSL